MDIDRLARALVPRSRRTVAAALAAAALAPLAHTGAGAAAAARTSRKKKRRNPCTQKNWCVDRSHTCGPAGGFGRCLVKAFGGNVCAEILFQAATCAECAPPNCAGCTCVLAAGGGDRCNNGVNGKDFICVRS